MSGFSHTPPLHPDSPRPSPGVAAGRKAAQPLERVLGSRGGGRGHTLFNLGEGACPTGTGGRGLPLPPRDFQISTKIVS